MSITRLNYKQLVSDQLQFCATLVAKKFGRTDITNWVNGDFIKLSSELLRETRVYISTNTLKRMFGKLKTEESYIPQKASLDALAVYLGFVNWEDFEYFHRKTEDIPIQIQNNDDTAEEEIIEDIPMLLSKRTKFSVLVLMGAIGLFMVWMQFSQNNHRINLICKNPEGLELHSAVFKLGLPAGFDDSSKFVIDFGDFSKDTLHVGDKQVVHFYSSAGRYHAVLYNNNKSVDTSIIYIKTKGWAVNAGYYEDKKNYTIRNVQASNTHLSVDIAAVSNSGIDTTKAFFIDFLNMKKTNISGDNFILKATVKASRPFPGINCSEIFFTLYGDSSEHRISLIKPGCTAWAQASFSENKKEGLKDDLSALSADLSKGGELRLQVKGGSAILLLNNKEIFRTKYLEPLGRIYGLKIRSAGIGTIDNLFLQDINTGESF